MIQRSYLSVFSFFIITLVFSSCQQEPEWTPDIVDISPHIVTIKTNTGAEGKGFALEFVPDAIYRIGKKQVVLIGPKRLVNDNPESITIVFDQVPNQAPIETVAIMDTLKTFTTHIGMARAGHEPSEVFLAEIEPPAKIERLKGNDFLIETKISTSARDDLFNALEFREDVPKLEYPTGNVHFRFFELFFTN